MKAYTTANLNVASPCYSEGVISIYSSRLASEHLYSVTFRGVGEYRAALAKVMSVIDQRSHEQGSYDWQWTGAQVRVTRHARYTAPRFSARAWQRVPYRDERGNIIARPIDVMGTPTPFDSYWDGRIDTDD